MEAVVVVAAAVAVVVVVVVAAKVAGVVRHPLTVSLGDSRATLLPVVTIGISNIMDNSHRLRLLLTGRYDILVRVYFHFD